MRAITTLGWLVKGLEGIVNQLDMYLADGAGTTEEFCERLRGSLAKLGRINDALLKRLEERGQEGEEESK